MGKSKQTGANVADYLGSVKNVKFKNGKIVGDLYVVDRDVATKLAFDDCQFAISPSGHWKGDRESATDFVIRNFAMVVNPAQKQAYINVQENISKYQTGWFNFAMSHSPQEVQTMDIEELKQEIKDTVSGAVQPLQDKISSLGEDIEAIKKAEEEKKKLEEEKMATDAVTEEEKKKKEETETLTSKVKDLEDQLKAYKDAEEEKKKKPEEEEPEAMKTVIDEEPVKDLEDLTRTEINKGMAEFLSNIGCGV